MGLNMQISSWGQSKELDHIWIDINIGYGVSSKEGRGDGSTSDLEGST